MKIAVFTSFFAPAFLGGGPIRTLVAMLRAAPSAVDIVVLTGDTDLGCAHPMDVPSEQWIDNEGSKVFYCKAHSWLSLLRGMREVRSWKPDVVYVNSLFDAKYSIVPQFLFFIRIFAPDVFIVAPRGEFSSGALGIKSTKKQAYLLVFRLLGLPGRVLWHASTAHEEQDIRTVVGAKARIVVREDDTLLPSAVAWPEERLEPAVLHAVSLSRLSPKKGVVTLLEGLQSVSEPLVLDVIGPEEDPDYVARCSAAAAAVPPNVQVNFVGPKNSDEIRAILAGYDVMLCPTKGENFGHVIAEALSVSCPVLCADVTPWSELLSSGGGQVVPENTADGWARAVEDYARLSHRERFDRRVAAGKAYERWKSDSSQPHFFTLLQKHLAG